MAVEIPRDMSVTNVKVIENIRSLPLYHLLVINVLEVVR